MSWLTAFLLTHSGLNRKYVTEWNIDFELATVWRKSFEMDIGREVQDDEQMGYSSAWANTFGH